MNVKSEPERCRLIDFPKDKQFNAQVISMLDMLVLGGHGLILI